MLLAATILIMLMLVGHVRAEPLPYVKGQGQCAGSYVQSGSYYVPKSGGTVREAVPKPRGASCRPSGWRQSGDACEKVR
jgi:hypothetical protein